MTDEKIIAIETTLSHHEQQIQEMSEMISAQWKEIERLRRHLENALSKIGEADGAPPASVRPPHY
jgi:SlyX protein